MELTAEQKELLKLHPREALALPPHERELLDQAVNHQMQAHYQLTKEDKQWLEADFCPVIEE